MAVVETLIMLIVVLAIVFIAVSIIKFAVKFLLKLGILALVVFLFLELLHIVK